MPARNLSCRYVALNQMHFSVSRPWPTVISKMRHAAGAEEAEGADFGDDAGHLAGAQFADAARIQPVFVAKRQVVEQVFDGADALFQQDLGKARADAFDVLNVGGEIEHRAMVNEASG